MTSRAPIRQFHRITFLGRHMLPPAGLLGLLLGLCMGCETEPIFFVQCEDGCQTLEDECGEDGQHCAFYCDDELYAASMAGCTEELIEGDHGLPIDQMCEIVNECIEENAEQYK